MGWRATLASMTVLVSLSAVATGCGLLPSASSTASQAASNPSTARPSVVTSRTTAATSSTATRQSSDTTGGYSPYSCIEGAAGKMCSEQSMSYALYRGVVGKYRTSPAGQYFPPTTWTLPARATGDRPISSLPSHTEAKDALSSTSQSKSAFLGEFLIYSGWQVSSTTRVWIGQWQGSGLLGAIIANTSNNTATYTPIAAHMREGASACAPGSACISAVAVVGIKEDQMLLLYGSGGYSVFNWKTRVSVPSNQNGVPSAHTMGYPAIPASLLSKLNSH